MRRSRCPPGRRPWSSTDDSSRNKLKEIESATIDSRLRPTGGAPSDDRRQLRGQLRSPTPGKSRHDRRRDPAHVTTSFGAYHDTPGSCGFRRSIPHSSRSFASRCIPAMNPWLFPVLGVAGMIGALALEKWMDGDGSATMATAVTFFVDRPIPALGIAAPSIALADRSGAHRRNHRRSACRPRVANRAAALVRAATLKRFASPIMVNAGAAEIRLSSPPALSRFLRACGEIAELSFAAARLGIRSRRDLALVGEQLDQVGVRSLSIVNLTAMFMGMVLALQMGNFLAKFGAQIFVSRVVGVSLLRELAPVLTALMVGGRVGAGITAELGSMAVSEQIDAIRSLGADPVRKLVVPRMVALLVMLPLLTVIADAVGVAGGCLISITELGLTTEFYNRTLLQALAFSDFFSGLAKAVFFAYFIGIIACHNGLAAQGGADGVGRATTATVVAASVAVLVADFFLSKLFLSL